MKSMFKTAISLSVAAIAPMLMLAGPAAAQTAQPTGLQGHYVGAGVGLGLDTEDGFSDTEFGGVVQGRYDIKNAPISLRGSVLFNGKAAAIQPMLTYDIATSNKSNVYLGGGASVLLGDGESPLGDKTAFMLTAGVEGEVAPNWALFGDVRWGISALENSDGQAISFQTGAAYRF
jgi:outer membrane autotransporter protein